LKLLETIRFDNSRFDNLAYHQQRMNRSRKVLLGREDEIDLKEYFYNSSFQSALGSAIPTPNEHRLFKCRLVYSTTIEKVEFFPYHLPKIHSLRLVIDDEIDYSHKYIDRQAIEKLLAKKDDCDDILIVKNGLITDTSFANILFFNGKEWITPAFPLLKGTRRAQLLDEEKIRTADIHIEDLKYFKKARLVNAMIRFEDKVDILVENIEL